MARIAHLKNSIFRMKQYISTRGQTDPVSFSQAVEQGLAPDGGLFLPEELPDLSAQFSEWADLPYAELCLAFFQEFADDIPNEELSAIIGDAYGDFEHPETAPVRRLAEDLFVLETFHGPTLAFKDFALQLLGRLYGRQVKFSGRPINVLGATSGDTGAAAIHGLLDVEGAHTFILYPLGRVSPLQERQMTCTGSPRVFPLGIEGSFDDAQAALKECFADEAFTRETGLSAVNSINLARILAQCVYYIYAWFRLPGTLRGEVDIVVPTGNFGNILAAWLVMKMGLPIPQLTIATNQNDILHRLFTSGEYRVDAVAPSFAPSMDIQVASNFERFIYYAEGQDPVRTRAIMAQFKSAGHYHFASLDRSNFSSTVMTDAGIPGAIRAVKEDYDYLIDPHTACAFAERPRDQQHRPRLVVATAHPAKFPETIEKAIGEHPTHPALERLKGREICRDVVDPTPEAIKAYIRGHRARL
jgi:threonine synthase